MPIYTLAEYDFPKGISRKQGQVEITEENARKILKDAQKAIAGFGEALSFSELIEILKKKRKNYFK